MQQIHWHQVGKPQGGDHCEAHPVLKLSSRSPLKPLRALVLAELSCLGDMRGVPELRVRKSCLPTRAAFNSPASEALCLCLKLIRLLREAVQAWLEAARYLAMSFQALENCLLELCNISGLEKPGKKQCNYVGLFRTLSMGA